MSILGRLTTFHLYRYTNEKRKSITEKYIYGRFVMGLFVGFVIGWLVAEVIRKLN